MTMKRARLGAGKKSLERGSTFANRATPPQRKWVARDPTISREVRDIVYRRSAGRCIVCRERPAVQVHHVLPKSRFPQHALETDNLVGVCPGCHDEHERAHRRIRLDDLPAAVIAFARHHEPGYLLRYYDWPDSRFRT